MWTDHPPSIQIPEVTVVMVIITFRRGASVRKVYVPPALLLLPPAPDGGDGRDLVLTTQPVLTK